MGDMLPQYADVERRFEGFPSQFLRRAPILHRLKNTDFEVRPC